MKHSFSMLVLRFAVVLSVITIPTSTIVTAFSATPPPKNNSNNKVETAAVKRFTNFDKLCKTCPTLLQPKVSTLTEMIMGLPVEERNELLHTVTQRILQQEQQHEEDDAATNDKNHRGHPIQTPKDMFQFETGVNADATITPPSAKQEKTEKLKKTKEIKTGYDVNINTKSTDVNSRIVGKINKVRTKFLENKHKLKRVQCLLDQTNALLAAGSSTKKASEPPLSSKSPLYQVSTKESSEPSSSSKSILYQVSDLTDPALYHCVEELQQMTRTELKMQRFKYIAQKAKCEQKLAKSRGKLYKANLELLEQQKQQQAKATPTPTPRTTTNTLKP